MSNKTNPTLIGVFIVGACILLIGGIAALGSGVFQKAPTQVVAYFDASVTGLQIGAPVKFRGVTIGQVTDMNLVFNKADKSFIIPVIFEIWPDKVRVAGGKTLDQMKVDAHFSKSLIRKGLRAELMLMSFVTGQLFVQLDYYPNSKVKLLNMADYSSYGEIPTIPSQLSELTETIKELPLKKLAHLVEKLLTDADVLISSEELKQAIISFGALMDKSQVLVENVDQQVTPLSKDTQNALQSVEGAFDSVNEMTAKESSTRYKIDLTLDEVAAAAQSLKLFANYLERHPEALLQGKKGGR